MATIRTLSHKPLNAVRPHTDVEATYTIVDVAGEKMLQIDTYGSPARKIAGKQSQSIRIPADLADTVLRALEQL